MAVRSEDLVHVPTGVVVAFPVHRARQRAARYHRADTLARVAVTAVTLVIAVLALRIAFAPPPEVVSAPGAPPSVVVSRGDTLWGIAARHAEAGVDRRAYIHALVSLNEISGAISPGARLQLP